MFERLVKRSDNSSGCLSAPAHAFHDKSQRVAYIACLLFWSEIAFTHASMHEFSTHFAFPALNLWSCSFGEKSISAVKPRFFNRQMADGAAHVDTHR